MNGFIVWNGVVFSIDNLIGDKFIVLSKETYSTEGKYYVLQPIESIVGKKIFLSAQEAKREAESPTT